MLLGWLLVRIDRLQALGLISQRAALVLIDHPSIPKQAQTRAPTSLTQVTQELNEELLLHLCVRCDAITPEMTVVPQLILPHTHLPTQAPQIQQEIQV